MKFFRRIFEDRRYTQLLVARDIADRELQVAVLSRDTKRINKAQSAMSDATYALMRYENAVHHG